MNNHKIKLIRNILNEYYKDRKKYQKKGEKLIYMMLNHDKLIVQQIN